MLAKTTIPSALIVACEQRYRVFHAARLSLGKHYPGSGYVLDAFFYGASSMLMCPEWRE
jgi:hypothetical protein